MAICIVLFKKWSQNLNACMTIKKTLTLHTFDEELNISWSSCIRRKKSTNNNQLSAITLETSEDYYKTLIAKLVQVL